MTRKIALLGSTGSIGRQTLDVVRHLDDQFEIVALAAGQNAELLQKQVRAFHPRYVSAECQLNLSGANNVEVGTGVDGLIAAATLPEVDLVVVATSGHAAILPTLRAIESGKTIALANKEVIVCAGEIIISAARQRGVEIRPVDSEHSAIWQCLNRSSVDADVTCITLTASGGPFLNLPIPDLQSVTVREALSHPTWSMGGKITIDSATMMNKGLEVIEAHWLFSVPYDQIEVVIHPQSIVHSLVSFTDGSVLAHLGVHDMRLPIQHALTYPHRVPSPERRLDIARLSALEFLPPDLARFPALNVAREAGIAGSTYPTVLSGADEVAVDAFRQGQLRFPQIVEIVDRVLDRHVPDGPLNLQSIAEADSWARAEATRVIHAETERP